MYWPPGGDLLLVCCSAAHLSTLILNWQEDQALLVERVREWKAPHAVDGKLFRALQLISVLLFVVGGTGNMGSSFH